MTGKWIERNGYPQFVGTKRQGLDIVHAAIFKDSYAVKRSECFDLPPRENIMEYVRLKGESARVYDQMAEEMVARLENGEITEASIDRKSVELGKRVAVRVDLGGRRTIKKHNEVEIHWDPLAEVDKVYNINKSV